MALKYYFEYKDIENNSFRCEISNDDYTDAAIEIRGKCTIDYTKIDQIYTVIRGGGMRIDLEANSDITLEDLYSDDEKANKVTLHRNGDLKFRGFIDPSGLFEDLVNDKWTVQLDCIDGLALLENLSYVDDEGNPFFGKASDIEVISRCLKRTGVVDALGDELLLRSSINTRYNGLDSSLCPLDNTYSNQERFYRDDGETIDSCKSVLESTLRKYGGFISLWEGKYEIGSFYEVLAGERRFYTYRAGSLVFQEVTDYNPIFIGSKINNSPLHWINANQRKEIIPPVGAVKVNYKYGFVQSLLLNPSDNINGNSIDGWNIIDPLKVDLLSKVEIISSQGAQSEVISSNPSDVDRGTSLKIGFTFVEKDDSSGAVLLKFTYQVTIIGDTSTYYLKKDGTWTTDVETINIERGISFLTTQTLELETEELPISGEVQMVIWTPFMYDDFLGEVSDKVLSAIRLFNVSLSFSGENLQGENHTQQVAGKNTRVEDVIEVSVGDNPSDIYLGALYKADTTTNTDLWTTIYFPNDIVGNQSILEILSEQISIYKKAPAYKMIGDVYGFIPYVGIYTFDLIPDKIFILSSYSYETQNNTTSCEWMEVKRSSYFGNSYEFAFDYGNVVKPTIIG